MDSEQVWQQTWTQAYDCVIARCRRAIENNVWQQTRKATPRELSRLRDSLDEAVVLETLQAREDYDG
jgi:hypothetical protein